MKYFKIPTHKRLPEENNFRYIYVLSCFESHKFVVMASIAYVFSAEAKTVDILGPLCICMKVVE
jgi:hypothetical protein